jgi:hypothetical protein
MKLRHGLIACALTLLSLSIKADQPTIYADE